MESAYFTLILDPKAVIYICQILCRVTHILQHYDLLKQNIYVVIFLELNILYCKICHLYNILSKEHICLDGMNRYFQIFDWCWLLSHWRLREFLRMFTWSKGLCSACQFIHCNKTIINHRNDCNSLCDTVHFIWIVFFYI